MWAAAVCMWVEQYQGLLFDTIRKRHHAILGWCKLLKPVEDEWLLGRRYDQLEAVRLGGALRAFTSCSPPPAAWQSVEGFKAWFQKTYEVEVRDKLAGLFEKALEKKAHTAVNSRCVRDKTQAGKSFCWWAVGGSRRSALLLTANPLYDAAGASAKPLARRSRRRAPSPARASHHSRPSSTTTASSSSRASLR